MSMKLGIYVHIPFCASKCGYCDFYSLAGCDRLMPKYQDALVAHIRESYGTLKSYEVDTVYFGGGTPSYYGAERLAELWTELKNSGRVRRDAEVTLEANPDSAKLKDLKLLRREGFNRISLGVQSANNDILKLIGRRHNWLQAEQAVQAARDAGFDNLSIDLIYGLPSQTRSDWADTLMKVIDLRPEHISCYGLTLEEGTPMYKYKGSPFLPSDDEQADMYLYAVDQLAHYGYAQYEISNFAIRGYESRHNLRYWRLEDYLGFGAGAHSCVGGARFSYIRDADAYIVGVLGDQKIVDEYEPVNSLERIPHARHEDRPRHKRRGVYAHLPCGFRAHRGHAANLRKKGLGRKGGGRELALHAARLPALEPAHRRAARIAVQRQGGGHAMDEGRL